MEVQKAIGWEGFPEREGHWCCGDSAGEEEIAHRVFSLCVGLHRDGL